MNIPTKTASYIRINILEEYIPNKLSQYTLSLYKRGTTVFKIDICSHSVVEPHSFSSENATMCLCRYRLFPVNHLLRVHKNSCTRLHQKFFFFFLELCCVNYVNSTDFDRYSLELRPGSAWLPLCELSGKK